MVAPAPPRAAAKEEMRSPVLVAGVLAIGALALPSTDRRGSQLLWNTSASVPVGLYLAAPQHPSCGTLAVIRLPDRIRVFAAARGYLPMSSLLIKPVVACSGSTVCRYGLSVTIDGRIVAYAKESDAAGRPMPRWQGCYRLDAAKVFLLSPLPDSFDSRYFGPIDHRHVLGTAIPVALVTTILTLAQHVITRPTRSAEPLFCGLHAEHCLESLSSSQDTGSLSRASNAPSAHGSQQPAWLASVPSSDRYPEPPVRSLLPMLRRRRHQEVPDRESDGSSRRP